MENQNNGQAKFDRLRRKAEDLLHRGGELLHAQQELRSLKNRYQAFFEYAPVGYLILDPTVMIRETNTTALRLLEVPKTSLIGSSLIGYISTDSRQILHEHVNRLLTTKEPQHCEVKLLRRRNGIQKWVRLEFCYITELLEQAMPQIQVAVTDISREKRQGFELTKKKQDYTDIVELANSIIVRTDANGIIEFMNRTGLDFFGLTRSEVIGKPVLGTIIPETETTGRDLTELVKRIVKSPHLYAAVEHENVLNDGRRVWIHWQNKAIPDNTGRIASILGVGQDITARKEAEEIVQRDRATLAALVKEQTDELLQLQTELDRGKRLADLGRISATIAHELRRPLAAMKLSLYNIRKKRENPAIDTHLYHLEAKLSESEQIIQNLVKFSQLKEPVLKKTDLGTLVSEVIATFESSFINIDAERIDTDFENLREVDVRLDRVQMQQAVTNILQNAFEAVDGAVGRITVRGFLNECSAGFEVIDTGAGITEEDLPQVTKPFFSSKHTGIGLGLTIVREIVSLHNGTLDIRSRVGEETTVSITLPRT